MQDKDVDHRLATAYDPEVRRDGRHYHRLPFGRSSAQGDSNVVTSAVIETSIGVSAAKIVDICAAIKLWRLRESYTQGSCVCRVSRRTPIQAGPDRYNLLVRVCMLLANDAFIRKKGGDSHTHHRCMSLLMMSCVCFAETCRSQSKALAALLGERPDAVPVENLPFFLTDMAGRKLPVVPQVFWEFLASDSSFEDLLTPAEGNLVTYFSALLGNAVLLEFFHAPPTVTLKPAIQTCLTCPQQYHGPSCTSI